MADESSAQAPGPLDAGTILQGRYVIERLLGGGGMGMVYLARDQRLANRGCAIKEMVDHFIDPNQRLEANEYFAREADTLAQLKHAAIPAITDRFDDQNRHYLVMEYVEGRNLEEELAARGETFPEGLVIDIARQLCDVLSYLHGMNPPVIYRDMKPSNVMLTPKGRVILIDFGIARLFRAARKGTMIGTLGFAPPEQYQGMVDPRSDIYSLGATMHYVLTGRDPEKFPPFSFPPVRELRPDVSSNLAGAIDRALAYKVEDRPGSVAEFRDMMLYGRGLTSGAASRVSSKGGTADLGPPPVAEPIVLPPRRKSGARRAVGLLVFSATLGAIAFGATYIYSSPELQARFGIQPLIDNLPWKHEELLAKARLHPLDFQRLSLELSTREGTALSSPRANFTDTELSSAQYLKWTADFNNAMSGLEGRTDQLQARFFDPAGTQIAVSDAGRFIGPKETAVDFTGVALIPDLTDHPHGQYKVALYLDDQFLAQEGFSVTEDLAAKAKAEADKEAADAAAADAVKRKRDEDRRLAMIEDRKRQPLHLVDIRFLNTTKTGTPLSNATDTFSAAKVLFIGWEVNFENRLFNLDTNQYRVDAAYIGPDGRTLGSVDDIRMVPENARTATFTGRVGNSAGGAFLPGEYTVAFYLNGQPFAQRKFRVTTDVGLSPDLGFGGGAGAAASASLSSGSPTLASGHIDRLGGQNNVPLELRLRPQPNNFLHGELVIHEDGYGTTGLEGFIRGSHLQFQVPYGSETLYFEGERRRDRSSGRDQLSGSFQATPSGEHGSWSANVN